MKTNIFKFFITVLFGISALLISTSLLSCSTEKEAIRAAYYLDSESGDDSNDGRSPETAWKTLSNLKSLDIEPGDNIYLKRGSTFSGFIKLSAKGTKSKPVVIDAYGEGPLPLIEGNGGHAVTVHLYNCDYLTFQNIEISNTTPNQFKDQCGLKIECKDFGVSHDIQILGVTVRDVNGSLLKGWGAGCGINIVNHGDKIISTFKGLRIEGCHILRCQRNGIMWWGYASRTNWYPNHNTVVRGNLIEGVPGDGIVPIGCDGVLIEYNIMKDCPYVLPNSEYAAGIWPWSCDNVTIQYNDVSGHKAKGDGQAYDCDDNCNKTIVRYNYSHECHGGLVLVCEDGYSRDPGKIGAENSEIYYNISIGDGCRPNPAGNGKMFSPSIHVVGPCKNTSIYRNIIHANNKPNSNVDRTMICSDTNGGYPEKSTYTENIFYAPEKSQFKMFKSTNQHFEGNWYIGSYSNLPSDVKPNRQSEIYQNEVLSLDPKGYEGLYKLMDTKTICGVEGHFVNKEKIEAFFERMKSGK